MKFAQLPLLACFVLQANSLADCSSGDTCDVMDEWQEMSARSLAKKSRSLVQKGIKVEEQLVQRAQHHMTSRFALQQQLDHEVAAHLRRQDPEDMVMVALLFTAVTNAMVKFQADPPQITEGIKGLGLETLGAFESKLKKKLSDDQYDSLSTQWKDYFNAVPQGMTDIEKNIKCYLEQGDTQCLVFAIEDILDMVFDAVTLGLAVFPETSTEITKYFEATQKIMGSVADTWGAFESGDLVNSTQAAEKLFKDTMDAVELLLPQHIMNDTNHAYHTVADSLDAAITLLSKQVYEYRQAILKSAVCVRGVSANENKKLADQCPSGYTHVTTNGKAACQPKDGASAPTRRRFGSMRDFMDTATARKSFGKGAVWAFCSEDGDHPHYHSHYCYGDCVYGWSAIRNKCKVSCIDPFPQESNDMCGKHSGAVEQWTKNLIMQAATTVWTVVSNGQGMNGDGVTGRMSNTINALATFGQAFTRPHCEDVMK
mmetsp:Transcript_126516/g.252831  ORF Transcript_126516/g.252831 Transcript_126516/m.252831 type:complete len:484 (-) Transcript_126516:44-1495(-)